jgi:hypothetical protein
MHVDLHSAGHVHPVRTQLVPEMHRTSGQHVHHVQTGEQSHLLPKRIAGGTGVTIHLPKAGTPDAQGHDGAIRGLGQRTVETQASPRNSKPFLFETSIVFSNHSIVIFFSTLSVLKA